MNHYYIITNSYKDKDNEVKNRICDYLERHGKKCTLQGQQDKTQGGYTDVKDIPADVDCIIVLGGDGTLLQAAHDVAERDIPLLGVNLGTLGYLAEVDSDKLESALKQLVDDDYDMDYRMMLTGKIVCDGKTEETDDALNDIVLSRSGSLRVIMYDIFVNGQFLKNYVADGMILSTPTGSTGYNMSAGGPIVEPTASLMVLTPVCPHTLNARSIILSPEDVIEIRISEGRNNVDQEVMVNFDGGHARFLHTGDRLVITKSVNRTQILKLNKLSFLEVLHNKMNDV